ncbi:S1/P1 nuclease [Pseudomonas duriflava]|uniref:S1/P1 nuclease n=1 Tax=Pseudomonas duriflava TaxID=459528 RepID=A0A562QDG8_9PSED|nr:S1/P1 nuclease [Pseudomonas duriflava]TWI54815.1 S1/P1 nuclease [Pseudomonas duriflava]
MNARSWYAVLATVIGCTWHIQALAWGQLGHALVADLAERQLSPIARVEAQRLLAVVDQPSLAAVSSWADSLRTNPDEQALWKETQREHYINYTHADCLYEAARDCPEGQCIVSAIERNAAVLANPLATDQERVRALMFVVHYVGDIHQPLHNGYRDDKGGNDYPVRIAGKQTNLHTVWDSYLLSTRRLDEKTYAQRLKALPHKDATGPVEWSQESCRIVRDDGLYPAALTVSADSSEPAQGAANTAIDTVDRAYVAQYRPLAEKRIQQAAVRLAQLLNTSLIAGAPITGD